MIEALLLLAAAPAPQPVARLQATATARIVSGERISLRASEAGRRAAEAGRQRQSARILRREGDGRISELRLVEFQ